MSNSMDKGIGELLASLLLNIEIELFSQTLISEREAASNESLLVSKFIKVS